VIPFDIILNRAIWLVLGFSLAVCIGCPGPVPVRAPQCLDNPNLSNCGLCSSQPVCGWCASPEAGERGCFDRRQATCEHGTVVRLPEACDNFSDVDQGLVTAEE